MLNTWQQQQKLMEISNQHRATIPELNKTSLLYSALILEEASELMDGLTKIIDRIDDHAHDQLHFELSNARNTMHIVSLRVRDIIKTLPELSVVLTRAEAKEIADASTDIAVVNCGFAISSGFDGQACYDDVVGSNLSKANPETGMIDKTPDGKWIKGVNYVEPNLEKVIFGDTNE